MPDFLKAAACLMAAALCAPMALAQSIETIGVSPDGGTILVGGSNRTVYTVAADTLEVTDRRYVSELVRDIVFSADGQMVYFRDDADNVNAYTAADMGWVWKAEDADEMAYDAASGTIAVLDSHFRDDSVRLLSAETGAQMTRIALGKIKSDLLALEPGGDRAMILTGYTKTDAEQKQDAPDDLTKLQKADLKQKTDGYVSHVVTVDFEAGSFEMSETPYRVSFPKSVRTMDGKLMILRTNQDSMMLAKDGSGALIDLGEDYFNYAGMDVRGETYILTNGVELRFVPVAGGAAQGLLSAERLRGGPSEWVTAMAEAPDGTLYFGTNAYRLLKVGPDRGKVEVIPVY